jgi:hypothetical protein
MYRIYNNTVKDEYENEQKVDENKKFCVDHIYSTLDISRFKYKLLRNESELPCLLEKKYYVSANFSGSSCLLCFVKIKDRYYQFLVDRKTLSYTGKININNVKLTPINIKLDLSIYKGKGTIFDGIFIVGKNTKTFVITDVYFFKGDDVTGSEIGVKLQCAVEYFKSNYRSNDRENNVLITINKLYPIEKIDTLIKNVIPKIKDFVVKGICFYPVRSSVKLIYMLDNGESHEEQDNNMKTISSNRYTDNFQDNDMKTITSNRFTDNFRENRNVPNNNENKFSRTQTAPQSLPQMTKQEHEMVLVPKKIDKEVYLPKSGKKDMSYVFEMKKTDIEDVYNLYVINPSKHEGKEVFKRVKIGLAFVSSIKCSAWCRELFENGNNSSGCLINCKFHKEKQKWEPIKVAEDKEKPSLASEFDVITV